MGKVVNIEDYRPNQTSHVLWNRISGINRILGSVRTNPNTTFRELIMLERLDQLKNFLLDKVFKVMSQEGVPGCDKNIWMVNTTYKKYQPKLPDGEDNS